MDWCVGEQRKVTENNIYDFEYRSPRRPGGFRVLLQNEDRNLPLLNGVCTDLSEDGVAVDLDTSLGIGERVTLIMTLPGTSTSRRVAARVTNCHGVGYGFAFIFSSPTERASMQEYLESQLNRG
jgi:PilZ domain